MSWFSFWYWLEQLSCRFARYCRSKRDAAFDRDLDMELRRCRKWKSKSEESRRGQMPSTAQG